MARSSDVNMKALWNSLDGICNSIDEHIEKVVGSRRRFSLIVHGEKLNQKSMIITNMASLADAQAGMLAYIDALEADDED